jgi:hypothetical protein
MRVAVWRAAHQVFDTPRVLEDPLALKIIGAPEARIPAAPSSMRDASAAAVTISMSAAILAGPSAPSCNRRCC